MDDQTTQSEEVKTPKWLQKLQQESWQAEILISGGAFIGLIEVLSHIDLLIYALQHSTKLSKLFIDFFIGGFGLVTLCLVEGFLLHLILRGYWIGLIGLNFVFPKGIDIDRLKFQGRFSGLIKEANNTPHLIKLDKACSLVFAFTFFVIFSFAGFILFLSLVSLLIVGITQFIQPGDIPHYLRIPVLITIVSTLSLVGLSGIIVLTDFFTFGRLKRIKWLSKIYFPVHYVMSRITLSFLFRRLYYTIVSNIKPWYIILGLGIQIFATAIIDMANTKLGKDISPNNATGETRFLDIKENIIKEKSLQFSIVHIPALEDELLKEWKKEKKDSIGQSFDDIQSDERFDLITSTYKIYIDSIQVRNLDWLVIKESILGFEISKLASLIDVSDFPRGKHELIVRIRFRPELYRVDPSDPELNYYAKAYFFIDK